MDLFSHAYGHVNQPLAEKLRPKNLDEVLGQEHAIGEKTPLGVLLREGQLQNLIIWGPPGTGKTSFAQVLAHHVKAFFQSLNAVDAGAKALKEAGDEGRRRRLEQQQKTLLFVDEIHRFNKAQQDVLLPFVEKGDLYIVGATTENPSYELNRALLSRCRVIEFKRLEQRHLILLIEKALQAENKKKEDVFVAAAIENLIHLSDGDGRRILNNLEIILAVERTGKFKSLFPLTHESMNQILSQPPMAYDKKSQQHYDCISAFIKSVRGSDPNAAIYYLARMLKGGEDPVFIARRLVILASEDIGNAEPRALPLAIAALQAVELVGMPEARISLAQATTFLASCPKSNRSYLAINKALELVEKTGSLDVPLHLRSLSDDGNYKYPHDHPKAWVEQTYLPAALAHEEIYSPSQLGSEKNLKEYLAWLKQT